jgi:hypothetical protein
MSIWRLARQSWTGRYTPTGDIAEAQCAIGFSFGAVQDGQTLRPGVSNEELAQFARAHLAHLPLILQAEIADAYGEPQPGVLLHRIEKHRQAGAYLDTRELACQAWEVMQAHGWQTVVVLAHGHHVPRVAAVCRKLGMSVILLPGLESVGFCPDSVQPWTRGWRAWCPREAGAIVYYRWKGWLAQ